MEALSQLGIDLWSVLLYLVNFGFILWVLTRYVYKPLMKYVDERRETIKNNVNEAEELRQTFESKMKEQEERLAAESAEAQEKLTGAKKFAKQEAKGIITDAQAQRDSILTDANVQANAIKGGILDEAQAATKARIMAVVQAVLEGGLPEETVKQSVETEWKKLV
jgi:F-type H+-transporting ATPase subunit b